ncbi:MAG: tripartite tricarboxylate transporter substrate binding protein [Betaproteobacteria bacterium]
MIRKSIMLIVAAGLFLMNSTMSLAAYPDRPVKVVIPFAAGGGADIVGRLVFQKLSTRLGQSFVIENRGSAGGIIGADMVAKAAPDGYTLLLGQTGPNAINPALFSKMPYDPIKDFSPIIQLTSYPYVIVVNPNVPVKNLQELIALSKAKPGSLSFGTAGTGSSAQLAAELFMQATNITMTHIPYKGAGPALMDTMAGVVSLTFGDAASATPLVTSNSLRAIAVTSKRRSALLPQVPTVIESGYPGFEAVAWHAVLAPAKTPPEIIQKLNSEIAIVLSDPELQKRLSQDGIEIIGSSAEDFSIYIKNEVAKWAKVVRDANIKLD